MAEIYPIKKEQISLLRTFLYEAIFQPETGEKLPKDIVDTPELKIYVEDFGRPGDVGFLAWCGGRAVGAAWARKMRGYGFVAENIPECSVSVLPEYRGKGIGTALLKCLLGELQNQQVPGVSLSVQKQNPAVSLYERLGFCAVREEPEEWIMLLSW
ncbi:MAG: GNAT family N-acetyltransferase [Massiliimalia sp.]|jgi:ribosomal-protein-alanine N-acetyltransferase